MGIIPKIIVLMKKNSSLQLGIGNHRRCFEWTKSCYSENIDFDKHLDWWCHIYSHFCDVIIWRKQFFFSQVTTTTRKYFLNNSKLGSNLFHNISSPVCHTNECHHKKMWSYFQYQCFNWTVFSRILTGTQLLMPDSLSHSAFCDVYK